MSRLQESDLSQVNLTHTHTHTPPLSAGRSAQRKSSSALGEDHSWVGLSWLLMAGSSPICSLLCLWIQSTPPTLVLQKLLQYKLVLAALDFHMNGDMQYGLLCKASSISVQFSRSVLSDSLRPHESQHARPPCPSPTPGVHSDSRPSSW